jgi:hypothetical protein
MQAKDKVDTECRKFSYNLTILKNVPMDRGVLYGGGYHSSDVRQSEIHTAEPYCKVEKV